MKKLAEDFYIPDDFVADHSYYTDEAGTKKYTGITTILSVMAKPALIQWAANEAVKYVKEHAQEQYEGIKCLCREEAHTKYEVCEIDLEEARTAHTKKKEAAGVHGTDTHVLVEEWIKDTLEWDAKRHKGAWGKNAFLEHTSTTDFSSIKPFIDWAIENVDHFLFAERPVHSKTMWLAGTIDFGAVMKDGTRRVCDLKTGSGIYYEAVLQTEFYQMIAEEEGDEKYDGSVIVNLKKDGTLQTQVRARSDVDRDAALGLLAAYRGNATFIKK